MHYNGGYYEQNYEASRKEFSLLVKKNVQDDQADFEYRNFNEHTPVEE